MKLEVRHFQNYFDHDLNVLVISADGEEQLPVTAIYKKDGEEIIQISNTDYYLTSYDNEFSIKPILKQLPEILEPEFSYIYDKETDYDRMVDWLFLDTESKLSCKFSFEFWNELFKNKFDIYDLILNGLAVDHIDLKLKSHE